MSLRASARTAAAALALTLAGACATARPPERGAAGGVPGKPGFTTRALEVRGHGRLVLALPPGWTVEEPEEGAAGAARITRAGARFLVLLTPLWNPGEPESAQERADSAQLFAELSRREALTGSVEREIPLEVLRGPGVNGHYFSATDRSLVGKEAGPDEYRHVLQGAAAVGPVILAFSLLDDGPGPWRSEALELVRTARHVPDGGEEEGEALQPLPGIQTEPLRVALPGKRWAVLVDLPGFEVARVAAPAGSEHVLARWAETEAETDIVASVILAPAGDVRDAVGCRDRTIARLRASVRAVEELQLAAGRDAAAATYTIRTGPARVPDWHAHAFLWREGTCVGVHVSKADPDPDDVKRLDAILSSVRLAEDL